MLTRENWLRYHRVLALGLGFLFALLGLTGSLGVYREELDELLNPRLVVDHPGKEYASLDRIMQAVRQAHPRREGSWTLELPRSPRSMMTAWYEQPHETIGAFYAPLMVSVNPYTAEVVANRFWGETAGTWLLDLHTRLGLERWGWNAVGVLGLLLMLSVGSGLYLWWPGADQLLRAFTVRHDAGAARLTFDLHRLVGAFCAPILLLLAFTGFHLSYPEILESLAGSSGMSHGNDGPAIRSRAVPNNSPVGLEDAVFIARSGFPHAELRRVTTPDGDQGVYRVNFRSSSESNRKHPFTTVWVDRWAGHILGVRNPAKFSRGEDLAASIWPLHTGEAFGPLGRLLWFVAGLGLFLLYAGGLLHWLFRRGLVRDRAVDFAALGLYLRRLGASAARNGWQSLILTARLMKNVLHRLASLPVKETLAAWRQAAGRGDDG